MNMKQRFVHQMQTFVGGVVCDCITVRSLHMRADVCALSSEESRLNVDHAFFRAVKDSGCALTQLRRHETCSKQDNSQMNLRP